MARRAKVPKVKVAKLEIVLLPASGAECEPLGKEAYELMAYLIERHHPHLEQARMVLAWKRQTKADKDGRLHLGKAGKCADLQRQLHRYDWVIVLNREAFGMFTRAQRAALIDHELCHCRPSEDKDGQQKADGQGKKLWRVRKHDVEEFVEVVDRHGLWKTDLEVLFKAMRESKKSPLFGGDKPAEGKPGGRKRTDAAAPPAGATTGATA